MGQLPSYKIKEDIFPELERIMRAKDLAFACVEPKHLQADSVTFYRQWEIKREDGVRIVMWDTHKIDRDPADFTVILTLGSPNGKKGKNLLEFTEGVLVALGGTPLHTQQTKER
jgi:hypothetical protein